MRKPWRVISASGTVLMLAAGPAPAWAGNVMRARTWTGPVTVTICEVLTPGKSLSEEDRKKLLARGCDLPVKDPETKLLTPTAAAHVRAALGVWKTNYEKNIVLTEADSAPTGGRYIRFSRVEGEICSSVGLGKSSTRIIHEVHVADSCGTYTLVHELMHRVGIVHEHQRKEQVSYFTVKYTALGNSLGASDQFKIEGDKSGSYDFRSLMHYQLSNKYFTITMLPDGEKALKAQGITNPADKSNGVGQRVAVSAGDKAAMADLYGAHP